MIERIVIENFKSLRQVDLSLGRMNLFIGTNASGKSNFLDALKVLQGIGSGFTINEILDGKPRSMRPAIFGRVFVEEVQERMLSRVRKTYGWSSRSRSKVVTLVQRARASRRRFPNRRWRFSYRISARDEGKVYAKTSTLGRKGPL